MFTIRSFLSYETSHMFYAAYLHCISVCTCGHLDLGFILLARTDR
jgi:hypothetical protein